MHSSMGVSLRTLPGKQTAFSLCPHIADPPRLINPQSYPIRDLFSWLLLDLTIPFKTLHPDISVEAQISSLNSALQIL